MFGKDWRPAEATIVRVHTTKTTGDGLVSIHEYDVDVQTPEGGVLRARIGEPRLAPDFFPPSAGSAVTVEVDARSGAVRFDRSDPRLSVKQRRRMQR